MKHQNIRRPAALLILMTMVLGLLLGCSNGSSDDSTTPDGKVQLVFSYWGNVDEKRAMEATIKEFEAQNPDIKVKLNHIPSSTDYMTKMAAMAAGNSLPDVGYFWESSVLKWAESGKLMDISSLLADQDKTGKKLDILRFTTADGKVVGVSVANETVVMFYNKDIFDEAGIPYPPSSAEDAWTWDEFLEVAKKLTKDSAGRTPNDAGFDAANTVTYGAYIAQHPNYLMPLMWSNGGGILDTDNKTILLNKPETIEVLQAYQDLVHKHHVSPTPSAQATIPSTTSALLTRKVAMQFDYQYVLQSLHEAKENEGLNYGVAVLPMFDEPATVNGGSPIVVFNDTEHPEEAKRLAAFLMDPNNSLLMINEGLWMPNEEAWYTDEALTDKWIVEDVHTDSYKTAVVDYTIGYCRSNPYYTYKNIDELYALVWPSLDNVFAGTQSVQEAINNLMPDLEELIREQNG